MPNPYTQPKRALSGGFQRRFVLTTAAVSQDLITALTKVGFSGGAEVPFYHRIHVQRLSILVMTGSAGITWRFGNTAPDATNITPVLDMSTSGAVFDFDFKAQGVPLAAGRPLQVIISGAGAAADVYVEGFQEMTDDVI